MPKITKDMVLDGYAYRVEVPAHEYGEDIVFIVSSPSASEVAEARALRMRMSEIEGEVDPSKIDLGKALIAEEKARHFLIAKGLSRGMNEEWTVEDVDKIQPAVLARLWRVIDSLTGFTGEAEEAIKNFRKARKGRN